MHTDTEIVFEQTVLTYREGTSDKVYIIEVYTEPSGISGEPVYHKRARYGRNDGRALRTHYYGASFSRSGVRWWHNDLVWDKVFKKGYTRAEELLAACIVAAANRRTNIAQECAGEGE